jgi:hypothetical protein
MGSSCEDSEQDVAGNTRRNAVLVKFQVGMKRKPFVLHPGKETVSIFHALTRCVRLRFKVMS